MPKQYAREFRRAVCERLVAGEKVSALSKEVGVSEGTLYLWKRQALIDAGRAEGVKSFEADELAHAMSCVANPPQAALVVLGATPIRGFKSVSSELNGILAEVSTRYDVYHR